MSSTIDHVESLLRDAVLLSFGVIDMPCVRRQSALADVDSPVVDSVVVGFRYSASNRREREASLDLRRSLVELSFIMFTSARFHKGRIWGLTHRARISAGRSEDMPSTGPHSGATCLWHVSVFEPLPGYRGKTVST